MRYIVEIGESAEQEFRHQHAYIAERSVRGANSWAVAFHRALSQLEENPESRPLAPESEHHAEPIRQVHFKTRHGNMYRALFIIRGDRVFILHIRGTGPNIMSPDEVRLPET